MNLKISLLVLLSTISLSGYTQPSNLIFYTNNQNQRFQLFVNGHIQNNNFEQTVRLENIEARNYSIRIVFENKILGFIQKDIFVRPNTEKMYSFARYRTASSRRIGTQIHRTSPLRLDMLSEAPLNSVDDFYTSESNDVNDAIDYTTTATPTGENNFDVKYEDGNVVVGNEQNNISIGKNGIDLNFNVDEIINRINNGNSEQEYTNPEIEDNSTEIPESDRTEVSTELKTNTCTPSFTDKQFRLIVFSLRQEGFESKKLAKAKKVAYNNCLLTKQVREVINLFNFENNRVEFAKFAYQYVSDKENYLLLLDSFKFLTSKQEIREYINE